MRITESIVHRNMNDSLGRLSSDLQKLNQQIASGKRLIIPSDDPTGAAAAVSLHSNLDAMTQQKRNINSWRGWLKATEGALSSASNVVSRARELAVQMSNSTYSAAQRRNAAAEVDSLIGQLVALGNTRYGNRYVFSGYQDDAAAFDTTEVGGSVTAVTYAGDDSHQEVKLGANSRMETSVTGEEAFQDAGDLFTALIGLRDSLNSNDPQAVSGYLGDLTASGNNMATCGASVGSRLSRLDMRETIIQDTVLANTTQLSEIEDADLITMVTNLQAKEVVYQAALKTASEIGQLNLAAYL
ncbi:MAG: flagellar hook-associated protein FlgL [Pseudomonadota bacterium]